MPPKGTQSAGLQQRSQLHKKGKKDLKVSDLKRKLAKSKEQASRKERRLKEAHAEIAELRAARDAEVKELRGSLKEMREELARHEEHERQSSPNPHRAQLAWDVRTFIRQAVRLQYGSLQPKPYPENVEDWPMQDGNRLMQWNLDQPLLSETNRQETDALFHFMRTERALVCLSSELDHNSVPTIKEHYDVVS